MPPDPGAKITGDKNPPTKPEDVGHVAPSFEAPKTFNTLVIRPEYRISLELGDIESLFPWPIDSYAGRAARLQVLGMFYFPLNHRCAAGSDTDPVSGMTRKPDVPKATMAANREGYKSAWDYFLQKFCGVAKADLNKDASDRKGEAELKKRLKEWIVQQMNKTAAGGPGGHLPKAAPLDDKKKPQADEAKFHFAKIRLPGGYPSLSKNQLGEYTADQTISGMHFYDSRYEHEWNCYKANPVLGLIPLVATVEKRDPAKDEWKPVENVTVHFQLHKPYDLPAYDAARKPNEQLNRPAMIGSSFSLSHPTPPNYASGAGPKYFDGLWQKYQENKNTPLVNNAHVDCGGKRISGDKQDGSDVAAAGRNADEQRQKSLFWLGDYAGFTKKHDAPPVGFHNFKVAADGTKGDALVAREITPEPKWFKKAEAVNDAKHPHCVKIKTNEEGKAGVIFLPSRSAGDRYRFRVYLASDGNAFESDGKDAKAVRVETGTFVTWRNMRLTRVIRMGANEAGMQTTAPAKLMAVQYYDSTGTLGGAETTANITAARMKNWAKYYGVLHDTTLAWSGLPAFDLDTVSTGAIDSKFDGMRAGFARAFCELETDPGAIGGFTNDEFRASAKQGYDDCVKAQALSTNNNVKKIHLDVLFWRTQANPEQVNNITDGISAALGFPCPMRAYKAYDTVANTRYPGEAAPVRMRTGVNQATMRGEAKTLATGPFLTGFARQSSINGFLPGMVVIQGAAFYSTEREHLGWLDGIGMVNVNACYVMHGAANYRDVIGRKLDPAKLKHTSAADQAEYAGFIPVVLHEMGHCIFRVHAPGLWKGNPAGGVILGRHDCHGHLTTEATDGSGEPKGEPRYMTCLMSYRNNDGLFCSRCLFELRGWNIHGKMTTKGIDPIPPKAAVSAPGGAGPHATRPAQVTNLKTISGDKQVELTWNAAARAVSYQIRRDTAVAGPFNTVVANNVTQLNYVDGGVANDTNYWYRVRAVNSKGNGNWSSKEKARPGTLPAPVNVQVVEEPGNKAKLTWNAVATATKYRVRFGTSSGSYQEPDETAGLQFTINFGAGWAGRKLFFVISAVRGTKESDYSDEVTLTFKPKAPANLAAKGGDNKVDLTWDASSGATKYKIRRKEGAGAYADLAEAGGGSNAHTDATAQNGRTYTYIAKASNAGGDSPNSNEPNVTLKPNAPVLQALTRGNLQFTVRWAAVTGATSYKLQRKTGAGAYAQVATPAGGATNHVDAGLAAGESYGYKLLAVNASGDSKESNEVTGKQTPGPPTGLAAVDQGGRVRLTWTEPKGGDSYRLKRGTAAGGPYQQIATPGNTNYTDGTIQAGGTYYYVVTAADSDGAESANSNEVKISLKPGRPFPPTLVAGNGKITVNFKPVAGAKRHKVKYGTAPGHYDSTLNVGPGLSSVDITVRNGVTTYVAISGENDAGEGQTSSANSAMAKA